MAAGTVFERGLRFIVNMILARLLAPDQFGLMALVMAAIAFFLTPVPRGILFATLRGHEEYVFAKKFL